jgi:hypothetical protein
VVSIVAGAYTSAGQSVLSPALSATSASATLGAGSRKGYIRLT